MSPQNVFTSVKVRRVCYFMHRPLQQQGFIRDFLFGGGGLFWNSKIDIKYTFLGGLGGSRSRNLLTNHCPEIESGGFWQLADYSKVPSFVCKTTAIFSSLKAIMS